MKVLSISSEAFPLVKTGGLGDVAGALPLALAARGVQMKTLLPGYPAVMKTVTGLTKKVEFDNLLGERGRVDDHRVHPAGFSDKRRRATLRIETGGNITLEQSGDIGRTGEHHPANAGVGG